MSATLTEPKPINRITILPKPGKARPVPHRPYLPMAPRGLGTRKAIDLIIDYIACVYDVDRDLVINKNGKCRLGRVSEARRISMVFIEDFLKLSEGQTESIFGLTHNSLFYARRWFRVMCDSYPDFKTRMGEIRAEIHQTIAIAERNTAPSRS